MKTKLIGTACTVFSLSILTALGSVALGAPIPDGTYRGRYFGGEVKRKDRERIRIVVKTVEVESGWEAGEILPLKLALILKEKASEAALFIVDQLSDGSTQWRALTMNRYERGEFSVENLGLSKQGQLVGELLTLGKRTELRLKPTENGKAEGCKFEIRAKKSKRDFLQFEPLPSDRTVVARDRRREKKATNRLALSHQNERATGKLTDFPDSELGKFTIVDEDEFGGRVIHTLYPTRLNGESVSGLNSALDTFSALLIMLKRDRAVFKDKREVRLINFKAGLTCSRPTAKLKERKK